MSIINVISVCCIILLIIILLILIESMRECKRFKITKYDIVSDKIPESEEIRFVMIADLHNAVFGDNNSLIFDKVKEFNPDFITLAGDMVVCRANKDKATLKTADFINELSNICKIYYGIGNHEKGLIISAHNVGDIWKTYYSKISDNENIIILDNKSIKDSKKNIALYGLDLDKEYYKRFFIKDLTTDKINYYIGKNQNNNFNILIAHNPDYFESYKLWGADLVLSGHNHGGLVKLPLLGGVISPRLRIFPKYDSGLYEKENSKMILSSGMGAHSIKIRVNNIPELIFITIYGKRK